MITTIAAFAFAFCQQSDAQLLADLGSEDLVVRLEASRQIFLRGPDMIPELLKLEKARDGDLRTAVHGLLVDLGHPAALVGELKSDDTPGNARRARVLLVQKYDAAVRDLLLDAVKSDDDQQAIQAAYVLAEKGDGAAAIKANPDLVMRSCSAFSRAETQDYFWVAARVMLRLNPLLTESERESSFRKALRGVPAESLHYDVRDLAKICKEFKLPFPEPILDRFLEGLKGDHNHGNAYDCRNSSTALRAYIVPPLRRVLHGRDRQARLYACEMLLDLEVTDIPMESLAESMGRDERAFKQIEAAGAKALPALEGEFDNGIDRSRALAASLLLKLNRDRYAIRSAGVFRDLLRKDPSEDLSWEIVAMLPLAGRPAKALLTELLEESNPRISLPAATGLLDIGAVDLLERILAVALLNLGCDSHYANAGDAAKLFERIGKTDAAPVLRSGLESDDEQVVTWSASLLNRFGVLGDLKGKALDQVHRFAYRGWAKDEERGLIELLAANESVRTAVRNKLRSQWKLGVDRAEKLDAEIEKFNEGLSK